MAYIYYTHIKIDFVHQVVGILYSVIIYIYIYTQPLRHGQNMTQTQILRGLPLVWIFFLQEWLPYQSKELSLFDYLRIAARNRWIPSFPKGIDAKWNAKSVVQDFNSGLHQCIYTCRRIFQKVFFSSTLTNFRDLLKLISKKTLQDN